MNSFLQDEDQQFRFELFKKLKDDYNSNTTKSAIYLYCKDIFEKKYNTFSSELAELEKKGDSTNEFLEKQEVSVRLRYFYNQTQTTNIESYYYFFLEVLKVSSQNSRRFMPNKEAYESLSDVLGAIIKALQNEELNYKTKTEFCNLLDKTYASMNNAKSKKEIVKEIKTYKDTYTKSFDELYALLINLSICNDVDAYFYDVGFSSNDNESTWRKSGNDKSKERQRKPKIDKSMLLIKKCVDKQILGFNGANITNIHNVDNAKSLFEKIINKGLDTSSNECYEYENIFIPLLVDQSTGVTMCIIGRSYFEKYYETVKSFESDSSVSVKESNKECSQFKEFKWPCILTVLQFTDVADILENESIKASVMYKISSSYYLHYDNQKRESKELLDTYFDAVYSDYREEIRKTINTFKTINELSCIPFDFDKEDKNLDCYKNIFNNPAVNARKTHTPQTDKVLNQLATIQDEAE